jgi:hypothetical protein
VERTRNKKRAAHAEAFGWCSSLGMKSYLGWIQMSDRVDEPYDRQLQPSVVGFFDIMGFRELVEPLGRIRVFSKPSRGSCAVPLT